MYLIGVFILLFILFACLRMPVPFAAGLSGMIAMAVGGIRLSTIPGAMFGGLDSFPFLAIPAFIYAGDLMTLGGISKALMTWVRSILGRIRGSVGATVVVSSALFGTISGSSVATVSAIGGMMLPEMVKAGYDKKYAASLIAAAGYIGVLIPPSIPGVIYALTAGVPVAEVWMSTFVAGIFITIVYILYNRIFHAHQELMPEGKFTAKSYFKDIGEKSPRALIALLMPLIIFVGVYGGILTPTEAGAVAVVYGLLAGWIIYPLVFKDKAANGFIEVTRKSAITSAAICMLIGFAAIASTMFTYSGAAVNLTNFLFGLTENPLLFLLIVNIFLLLVGMFMETNVSILLLGPILVPTAVAYGIDPIHFGAIMLLNLEIGMITPPFAANLFVACRVGNLTLDQLIRPIMGFILVAIPVLLLITYVPALSLTPVEWIR